METIKIEHRWDKTHNRWIYLAYDQQNKICGMNFMYGNDYETFKNVFAVNDSRLMKFYGEMLQTFPVEESSVDRFTFINKVICALVCVSVGFKFVK